MKRLFALAVSLAILAVLYAKVDLGALVASLRAADPGLVALAFALELALTLATAWRFTLLAPRGRPVAFRAAARLTFVGSTLNLFLPLKLGDLAKALALGGRGGPADLSTGLALVGVEKLFGLMALATWGAVGIAVAPVPEGLRGGLAAAMAAGLVAGLGLLAWSRPASWLADLAGRLGDGAPARVASVCAAWLAACAALRAEPGRLALVAGASLGLWLGYIVELWLLLHALEAWVPFVPHMAYSALSVLAGSLPMTFAGIGTRDAAIVVLYAPYLAAPTAAAFGVLCTGRYLACALIGLPFLARGLARSIPAHAPDARSLQLVDLAVATQDAEAVRAVGGQRGDPTRELR